MELKITNNFNLSEFITSETAVKNKIKNVPNEAQIQNIIFLVKDVMQPIRTAWGEIEVTSGFRCEELNRLVGGSKTSFHRLGLACDFVPKDIPKEAIRDVFNWVIKNVDFDKLIWEFGRWIHIQTKTNVKENRHEVYRAEYKDEKAVYIPIKRI